MDARANTDQISHDDRPFCRFAVRSWRRIRRRLSAPSFGLDQSETSSARRANRPRVMGHPHERFGGVGPDCPARRGESGRRIGCPAAGPVVPCRETGDGSASGARLSDGQRPDCSSRNRTGMLRCSLHRAGGRSGRSNLDQSNLDGTNVVGTNRIRWKLGSNAT